MTAKLIKGNISSIPAELLVSRVRNTYNWDEMEVGDCKVFDTVDDFSRIRSSYNAFAVGTKERGKRHFKSRIITTGGPNNDQKVMEVYRLPDPTVAIVETAAETSEPTSTVAETDTVTAITETFGITEIPSEINPPMFDDSKKKNK